MTLASTRLPSDKVSFLSLVFYYKWFALGTGLATLPARYRIHVCPIRRINTEEEAKVVAVVWGTELIQLISTLANLHQDDLKKGRSSSYSSNRPVTIRPVTVICV